ncbi:MAG: hypothetical protein LBO78_01070 [Rickettsiales bacterium]|jgi:hypothetical protein|nr:hypothetical protein [Rickettsiales bacterium]
MIFEEGAIMQSIERPPGRFKFPFDALRAIADRLAGKAKALPCEDDILFERFLKDRDPSAVPDAYRDAFVKIGHVIDLFNDVTSALFEHDLLDLRYRGVFRNFVSKLEKRSARYVRRGKSRLPPSEIMAEISRLSGKKPRPLGQNINSVRGVGRLAYFNIDDLEELFLLIFVHPNLGAAAEKYDEWLEGNYDELIFRLTGLMCGFAESQNVSRLLRERYGKSAYKRAAETFLGGNRDAVNSADSTRSERNSGIAALVRGNALAM